MCALQVPEVHDYEVGRLDPSAAKPGEPHRVAYKQHDAPDEVIAFSNESEYKEYRQLTDLREPYQLSKSSQPVCGV